MTQTTERKKAYWWWTHLTVWEFAGLYKLWIDISWKASIIDGKVDVSYTPTISLSQ